ncbi:MAG: hypothetical protein BWY57_01829 [Betaproteobacteria bacterium ADurb.Bin341]|nr:MAG: hypothetical protein BWY57_01829 [Betaproteobacteria bacterium ADurb.Bin341]
MELETAVTPTPAIADWRAILAREVELHPRGKAGVAERLGVSRAYVSRAMSEGTSAYDKVPQTFISRVLDLESDVDCPATGGCVARSECRKALLPAPTHNPLAMRIWRECQTCAIKPRQEAK